MLLGMRFHKPPGQAQVWTSCHVFMAAIPRIRRIARFYYLLEDYAGRTQQSAYVVRNVPARNIQGIRTVRSNT